MVCSHHVFAYFDNVRTCCLFMCLLLIFIKKQCGTVHPSLVFLQLFSNGVADTESTTAGLKLPPAWAFNRHLPLAPLLRVHWLRTCAVGAGSAPWTDGLGPVGRWSGPLVSSESLNRFLLRSSMTTERILYGPTADAPASVGGLAARSDHTAHPTEEDTCCPCAAPPRDPQNVFQFCFSFGFVWLKKSMNMTAWYFMYIYSNHLI